MDVRRKFEEKHRSYYGYVSDDAVELVNVRVRAVSKIQKISLKENKGRSHRAEPEQVRIARIAKKIVKVPVYSRSRLAPGSSGSGPCIIEEYDSTALVESGWTWVLDSLGNLHMARGE